MPKGQGHPTRVKRANHNSAASSATKHKKDAFRYRASVMLKKLRKEQRSLFWSLESEKADYVSRHSLLTKRNKDSSLTILAACWALKPGVNHRRVSVIPPQDEDLVVMEIRHNCAGFQFVQYPLHTFTLSQYEGEVTSIIEDTKVTVVVVLNKNGHKQKQVIPLPVDRLRMWIKVGSQVRAFNALACPVREYTTFPPMLSAEPRLLQEFVKHTGIAPFTTPAVELEEYRALGPGLFHTAPYLEGKSRADLFQEFRKELGHYFGDEPESIRIKQEEGIGPKDPIPEVVPPKDYRPRMQEILHAPTPKEPSIPRRVLKKEEADRIRQMLPVERSSLVGRKVLEREIPWIVQKMADLTYSTRRKTKRTPTPQPVPTDANSSFAEEMAAVMAERKPARAFGPGTVTPVRQKKKRKKEPRSEEKAFNAKDSRRCGSRILVQ